MDKIQKLSYVVFPLVYLFLGSECAKPIFLKDTPKNGYFDQPCKLKGGFIVSKQDKKDIWILKKEAINDEELEKRQQVWFRKFKCGRNKPMTMLRVFGFGGAFFEKNETVVQGKFLDLEEDVKSDTTQLTREEAFQIAVDHEKEKLGIGNMSTPQPLGEQELIIYFDPKDSKAKLSYRFKFMVHEKDTNFITTAYVTVDVTSTGKVIDSFEQLLSDGSSTMTGVGGNQGTGQYTFGKGKFKGRLLQVAKDGNVCKPENDLVNVASALGEGFFFPPKQCFDIKLIAAFEETCNPKPPNKDATNNSFSQVHDGLYYTTNVIEMLRDTFEDETIKNKCGNTKVCVHFPDSRSFYGQNCDFYFGVGDNKHYDMASPSVVGHEVGHALVTLNSGLEPRGESGAIHEAFCDLTGVVYKASLNKFKTPDWKFGSEIIKEKGGAIRFMDDPPKDKVSVDHIDDFQSNLNVHHAAGIYNKAITKLTKTKGWGLVKTYKLFLFANRIFWTEITTFREGVCGLINAAKQLKFSSKAIEDAFAEVGVSCGEAPPPACKFEKLSGKCLPAKKCKPKKWVRCPKISPCDGKKICCFNKKKPPPAEQCGS